MMGKMWLCVFTIICSLLSRVLTDTACSEANRESDLEACLEGIRTIAQDNYRYWFGLSYYEKCPPEERDTIDCYSVLDHHNHSMISLIFHPGTFDPDLIDTYLDLTFTSEPGTYSGCGHTGDTAESVTFTLDPLAEDTNEPWHTRDRPVMSWDTEEEAQYSLVIIDAGFEFLHGCWVNIHGNDIANSEELLAYHTSENYRDVPNVYAYVLFKQQVNNMVVSDFWKFIIENHWLLLFNMTDFAQIHNLTGPVAMNWNLASYDVSSVEVQRERGVASNCVPFVQTVIDGHDRPFIPANSRLSVFVNATLHNEHLEFTYCCQDYHYPLRDIDMDPIGDKHIDAAEARTGNPIMFYAEPNKMFPAPRVDFRGKLYTMLNVDPDVPVPSVGTNERPLLHSLWTNNQLDNADGAMQGGDEIHYYRGPMPPDDKPHMYYFLLYEQLGGPMNLTDTEKYAGPDCSEGTRTRCLFNVTYFVQDNALGLVGASWMMSQNDDFVNMTRGIDEDVACADRPGYPCKHM